MDWKKTKKGLIKKFEFKDFSSAIKFVNGIMKFANRLDHHPDILIYNYNKVKIILFTHSKKKVTNKDYLLAKSIDGLSVLG